MAEESLRIASLAMKPDLRSVDVAAAEEGFKQAYKGHSYIQL